MGCDVLFIHPGNQKKNYQALSDEFTAISPPVWVMLLANYIRNQGFTAAIHDSNVHGWDFDIAKKLIDDYKPNLIVIMVYGHHPSASTQTMPVASQIAKDIKTYCADLPVAMGGTHPSALPKETLLEERIDFVIQGEGVYTVADLLNYFKGKIDIHHVSGLWYKFRGNIKFTSPFKIVQNLDEDLDGYAWDLLPELTNYRAHNMHCFQYACKSQRDDLLDIRSPYVALNASLGCPYSCSYCCINAIFGKPGIRYWSLEKILAWIDVLVNKYGIKNIRIDDELFILSPVRVEKFCDLIIERGYDLNLWVYGRVDTIKENLLAKLKKAGVNWICLGIESASKAVRDNVNKIIEKDVKEVVKSIQSHDIYVLGNYMFGLPEDDISTMQETLNQAKELNCEYVNFYTVMAYPGSELYKQVIHKDGYLPDDWSGFSQFGYNTQPLPTNHVSAKEVLAFRDNAFRNYYSDPKYLRLIENKFGKKVLSHIERMLNLSINRKLLQ